LPAPPEAVTGPAAGVGRPLSRSEAWELTRAVSPRPLVRVADVDAYGKAVNTYTRRARTADGRPDEPWAVYLTDQTGAFRLLAFDFDAAKGDPAADAATFCGWLENAGLPHLLTRSGPSGGRHVWLALAEAVDAGVVDTLARLVRARLTSLDIAPLSNPVTGCVRPPGSPHRAGGSSTVLAGDPAALAAPTATAADVARLVDALAAGHRPEPLATIDPAAPLPTDRAGRIYLPGVRRQLPAGSVQALQVDAAAVDANTVDASTVLRRVLVGAAAARWRCTDVASLVSHSPGLEHVRSQGQGPGVPRRVRSPGESRAVLARQWDRAVRWVAAHPRASNLEDPTFEPRAAALAAQVEQSQTRADAAAGRWAGPGGPADRRVLDALCVLSLHAMSPVVEADIRRLGLLCGIGRETARTALLRLARDGWVTRHSPADGPRAASWILDEGLSTVIDGPSRSQADPRPPGIGIAERNRWFTLLRTRLAAVAHDIFTPAGGLGHATGQLYATLTTQPASTGQLAHQLGTSPEDTGIRLGALRAARLARRTSRGWFVVRADRRDAAALRLGVAGRLDDRARRYALEREAFAWWNGELTWMHAPHRSAASRRPGLGQLVALDPTDTPPAWPAHPRRGDGRADFAAARRALSAGAADQPRQLREPTAVRRREAA
jgi:hypothetical protein